MHHYQDLISIFHQCFYDQYNTQLIKGDDEPLYLPAHVNQSYHAVIFAHGYFSSALHECAHWFVAGEARRQQVDYGYWYAPDGRNAEQQAQFQLVEVKPQAIEWMLSVASNHPFQFSIDNLSGEKIDSSAFKQAIYQQVLHYCQVGLPARAKIFHQALCQFYQTACYLKPEDYKMPELLYEY